MEQRLIQKTFTLTGSYVALSGQPLIVTGTLSCRTDNSGDATVQFDSEDEVLWESGEWIDLVRVDLARIQVKGTVGDVMTFKGGTW